MREASPDYLGRFMVYLDTLLCLDAPMASKPSTPKKRTATRSDPSG
jgi:hypothetical protein